MKPYGVKRNWNSTEDYKKNGKAQRPKSHTKIKKILHRRARRVSRNTNYQEASHD